MINITQAAKTKIAQTLNTKEEPKEKLRISIRGGGCAGFEYDFTIETMAEDGDVVIDVGDTDVLIDPISLPYIQGSTLDYVLEHFSSKFVFINPNAKTSCGCGKSFSG